MTQKASPVFLVLNQNGLKTARRGAAALPGAEVHGLMGHVRGADAEFTGTSSHLRSLFRSGRPIIGVCAGSVVIRALAPFLADTWAEPPVLVLAADGTAVVPLLGLHHGATELAARMAHVLGIQACLPSAGEGTVGAALDALPDGWRLSHRHAIQSVMAALVDGCPVLLDTDDLKEPLFGWLTEESDGFRRLPPECRSAEALVPFVGPRVRISDRVEPDRAEDAETLLLRPPTLAVGVGCSRGCAPGELESLVRESLEHAGRSIESVACVVSLDAKADESAVLALGEALDVPVRFLDVATLEAQTPRLATPSEAVFRRTGCHGIAEAAALAAAGPEGVLIQPKRKSLHATCALARSVDGICASRVGQRRGRLFLVDLLPGPVAWRPPAANAALAAATDIVGDGASMDLLGEIGVGKARHVVSSGDAADPVVTALDLAARGRDVALVSSDGAGIHILAARAFEVMQAAPDRIDWRRVDLLLYPGISALQAVATRFCLPLGQDFCSIRLSDPAMPRATVERRIRAAVEGDFCLVLYPPLGGDREGGDRGDLVPWMRDLLLRHRSPTTPMVLARDLGRAEDVVEVVSLAELTTEMFNRQTLVMVGAKATQKVGRWVYTPRDTAALPPDGAQTETRSPDGGGGPMIDESRKDPVL